ncbi:MAG: ABC transporter substrate-binding protein [Alphaproteobacteria bacterium]|nr:ABC transporter substrate-binding protein [Alphaproteobacteria bacterium]
MSKLRRVLAVAGALLLAPAAGAQTLIYCYEASPETFLPMQALGQSTFDVTVQMFNSLVEMERGSTKVIPALAESWSVSADGKTYDFKLRRGVKFHSNADFKPSREMNADDVVYTFKRMSDPNHPYAKVGGRGYGLYVGLGVDKLITAVDKVDDLTVRFTLSEPRTAFMHLMTINVFGVNSAEYHEKMLAVGKQDNPATNPIGTGPFEFVGYQKDATIRMRNFREHWARSVPGMEDRTAKVDNLVFSIVTDPTVRYQKTLAGECHIMRFPNPADMAAIKASNQLKTTIIPGLDYGFLGYNVQKKPFDDKRVRQALSLAINKKAIRDLIFLDGMFGEPMGGAVPPGLLGYDDSIKPYPEDIERAKKLLVEAGFSNGFKTTMWAMPVVRAYMPNARRTAELMQADLKRIGVEIEIVTVEWAEYLRRSQQGEHEIVILGWNYAYADAGQILELGWSCEGARNGLNRSRWCNEEFDRAINRARVIADEKEREQLYRQAQRVFYEEAPALLIAYASKVGIARNEVENFKLVPAGPQPLYGVGVRR